MKNMKFQHSIDVTFPQMKIALSPTIENNFLVYSNSLLSGTVAVFDMKTMALANSFKAHKSAVHLLSLNYAGKILATCSGKGTIIRVFSVLKGERLHTFKRGLSHADIYSMNFNINSNIVLVGSNSGTIHLFALPASVATQLKGEATQGWSLGGMMKGALTWVIPKDSYETIVESAKSFLQIKNSDLKQPCKCAVSAHDTLIFAVAQDGMYYQYAIDIPSSTTKPARKVSIFAALS